MTWLTGLVSFTVHQDVNMKETTNCVHIRNEVNDCFLVKLYGWDLIITPDYQSGE